MEFEFTGELWFWRGPAPHHWVSVPAEECQLIAEVARAVTYGWGMIPVRVRLGDSDWETSLFPKDGGYIVPIKQAVRVAEGCSVDDIVTVQLTVLGMN